jgi:hypothetical protein
MHQEGFRIYIYWRWKSKPPLGRPPIDKEIRVLIRRISRENPLWGTPRIQSEFHHLGFSVTEKTVAKYRVKRAKPPSQPWKTFPANHASQIASKSDCVRRFFHYPDNQFPRFVQLHRPSSQSQEDRSFQCDRESDSRVDRPSRSSKPFRMTPRLGIYSGIEIRSMEKSFEAG